MIENDYTLFWKAGQAILNGLNPYESTVYPPPTLILFVLFALLPRVAGFIAWTALNCLMVIKLIRSRPFKINDLAWLVYTPTLFILLEGQLDIFFLWIASFMEKKGWRAVLAAALLTLKPQLAFFLLPVQLLTWLKKDRRSLAAWAGCSVGLYLIPLGLVPQWYFGWLVQMQVKSGVYTTITPGIFSLPFSGFAQAGLVVAAAVLMAGALFLTPKAIPATLLSVTPLGTWYNCVILMKQVPARLLIPVSWLAAGLAVWIKASYPFVLIPLAAYGWFALQQRRQPEITSMLAWLRS